MLIDKPVNLRLYLRYLCLWSLLRVVNGDVPMFNTMKGEVNVIQNGLSNSSVSQVYYYEITESMVQENQDAKFRVYTNVSLQLASRECPLLFVIHGHRFVLSWELPIVHESSEGMDWYASMARTLCLEPSAPLQQTISVMVTSCSRLEIPFNILLTISEDLVVGTENWHTAEVSPTITDFYKYTYPLDTPRKNLFIQINSPESTCMKFSVQDTRCPIMDQETNVQFKGYWQTMSTKAGLTIRKDQFPDGFMLVFVVLKEDRRCEEYFGIIHPDDAVAPGTINSRGMTLDTPRAKSISFHIEETIGASSAYVLPTVMPLVFTLVLILVVFGIFTTFQNVKVKLAGKDQIDKLNDHPTKAKNNVCCLPWHSPIKIQDLKRINPRILLQQSHRYVWTIIIIGIFYCVPVFQLITNYLKVVYRTGEQDICYYNHYCARTMGYLMDFNHVYSNISYLLLGITFIIFVRIRRNSFLSLIADEEKEGTPEEAKEATDDTNSAKSSENGLFRKVFPVLDSYTSHGVLQHFGLFYAMGLALFGEGLLSGAYHICPNQSNFQFDTSFMYIIAVLGTIKVYQFRHPIQISVNVTFIVLAFVSSSAVLGLLFDFLAFKICFSVLYFFTILFLLIYLCFVGFIKDDHDHIVTGFFEVFNALLCKVLGSVWAENWGRYTITKHRSQIILPIGASFFNISFIVLQWTSFSDTDFATQLLGIFVMNLFLYCGFYIIMKWIHNEYSGFLWFQPCIYALLAGVFWGFALYFFSQALSSWAESPAESKTQNDFCIVANFYDNHDMWHFLSAGGLFCSFMMLLTIDDDLLPVKHSNIPVF